MRRRCTIAWLVVASLSTLAAQAEEPPAKAASEAAPPKKPPSAEAPPPDGPRDTPSKEPDGRRIEALIEDVRRFEEQALEFKKEIQLLIERKYEEKRSLLNQSYEKAISDQEVLERKERLDAIALFEEFLARYPNEPKYTPDAMMRLAELYYEKIEDDYRQAEKAYYARLDQLSEEEAAAVEPPPPKRYEKPIALYQRIISEFPDYRYADAAYYLLGYLLGEQGEAEAALATFDALIQRFPDSRFVPEVWMRIGEFFFDADQRIYPDALQRAIAAYKKVLPYKDHPLFDKVLYKLGWTYYRIDDFDNAVSTFADLLAYYQAKAEESGEEEVGGDLRQEAIQYSAISFADENWGSLEKAKAFFEARGHPKYEFAVMRRLGDVYYDLTKHEDAVKTYEYVLSLQPLHPDAPLIQEKIVSAYERDRSFGKAFEAQEKLVANYSKGSEWYEKNKDNPEVIERAEELTEKSLKSAALFHHQQAQQYREEGRVAEAFTEYKLAAEAYGQYLKLYPHTKDLYELQYYYADALFNSAQFPEAARAFAEVRDSNLDSTYLEDAALGAVLAWEKEIERLQKAGKLEERPVLTSKDWPEGKPVEKEPLPEPWQGYVKAADMFLKRLPDSEKAPNIAYKAAEVFYVYGDHEEARRRFEEIVKKYPSAEAAQYAANLILESLLIAKDWAAVEETSARLLSTEALQKAGGEVKKTFTQFKLGGRFKRAEQLFSEGKYEEAAKLYLALVKEAPKHEFADRALYNAAVAYEKVLRFESALKLYERVFREYPNSELADQALFLVAYNAERAFDFDKAISQYLNLVENYPQSQQREGALNNAAILLYLTQQYGRAAQQFRRFARLYPDAPQTPRLLLLAAESEEKKGDLRGAIDAYAEFIRRFKNDKESQDTVIEAHLKIAKAWEKLGNRARALAAYRDTVKAFERSGLDMSSPASEFAAEAQFMIAEAAFRDYDRVQIKAKGRGKRFQKSLKAAIDKKKALARKVSDEYKKVYQYKRLEWTLAAAYRVGYVLERFANSLYEAPVPAELKKLGEEYVYAYQDQLAQAAYPIEEEAVKAYITAVERARSEGIVNRWTKLTLESLNRFRPNEYPILKEAKGVLADEPLSPLSIAPTPEGIPDARPRGTRLGDDEPGGGL